MRRATTGYWYQLHPLLLPHTDRARARHAILDHLEGHRVAELLAGHKFEPIDKDKIPGCTYCHPQFASIGLRYAEHVYVMGSGQVRYSGPSAGADDAVHAAYLGVAG